MGMWYYTLVPMSIVSIFQTEVLKLFYETHHDGSIDYSSLNLSKYFDLGTLWGWIHLIGLLISLASLMFAEGYRCFQKAFSPLLAKRCFEFSRCDLLDTWMVSVVYRRLYMSEYDTSLIEGSTDVVSSGSRAFVLKRLISKKTVFSDAFIVVARVVDFILSPFIAAGMLAATYRRLVVSWGVVIGVVILIIITVNLPSPWRQIVDAGVVGGLSWGTVFVVVWTARCSVSEYPHHIKGDYIGGLRTLHNPETTSDSPGADSMINGSNDNLSRELIVTATTDEDASVLTQK